MTNLLMSSWIRGQFLWLFILASVSNVVPVLGQTETPAQSTSARGLPLLKTAREIHRLSREESKRGYPVAIQGIVICSNPPHRLFFIQDETAGIYVYLTSEGPWPQLGDRVKITGETAPGNFARIVLNPVITVLGKGELPVARSASYDQILNGNLDSQWVTVQGVLRWHGDSDANEEFEISSGSYHFKLFFHRPGTGRIAEHIGAEIRVRGVVGSQFSNDLKLLGFHLYVNTDEDVEVIEAAPEDPMSLPLVDTSDLFTARPLGHAHRLIKIKG